KLKGADAKQDNPLVPRRLRPLRRGHSEARQKNEPQEIDPAKGEAAARLTIDHRRLTILVLQTAFSNGCVLRSRLRPPATDCLATDYLHRMLRPGLSYVTHKLPSSIVIPLLARHPHLRLRVDPQGVRHAV